MLPRSKARLEDLIPAERGSKHFDIHLDPEHGDVCIYSDELAVELTFFEDTVSLVVRADNEGKALAQRLGWTEQDGTYYGLIATLGAFQDRDGPLPEQRPLSR